MGVPYVEVSLEWSPSKDELFPDGNAPDGPLTEEVVLREIRAGIKKCGSIKWWLDEWGLDHDLEVTVNGKRV